MTPREDVPMPPRIATLPRDARGYPVPWFVEWRDGVPLFPVLDPRKWSRAVRHHLCWVCGQPLGRMMVFPIGPMCAINRITSEPGCHRDCAIYSVKVCPFLVNPNMRRVPFDKYRGDQQVIAPPGIHSEGNPRMTALWSTTDFGVLRLPNGPIIELGEPTAVSWWTRGAPATAQQAAAAFVEGAARLISVGEMQSEQAAVACVLQVIAARKLLPDPNLVREIKGCSTRQ